MHSIVRPLVLLALAAHSLGAQGSTGVVTGTVRDETGRPVRDAVIALDADSLSAVRSRTDAEGRFRLDGVTVGRHELQVARIGFRPHRSRIDVGPDGIEVPVELQHVPVMLDTIAVRVSRTGIHGIVTTRGIELLPHDPRPLRGAIIEILDTPHRATTTADGRFSVASLGEGAYSLLVRIDRYRSRVLSVYVPDDGGVDVTVVLDSTIADWQRREDMELREISRRIREATNPSAFVSMQELAGPEGMTLRDALRVAPSTLARGLLVKDDVTCVYINGDPRPGMTAGDILADDVQAVEVYGINARGGTMVPRRRWQMGTFCGTGTRQGPSGGRMDNLAHVIVVWTKRERR